MRESRKMNILLSGNKGFIGTEIWKWLEESQYPHWGSDEHEEIPDEKFDLIHHLGATTLSKKSKELPY